MSMNAYWSPQLPEALVAEDVCVTRLRLLLGLVPLGVLVHPRLPHHVRLNFPTIPRRWITGGLFYSSGIFPTWLRRSFASSIPHFRLSLRRAARPRGRKARPTGLAASGIRRAARTRGRKVGPPGCTASRLRDHALDCPSKARAWLSTPIGEPGPE